MKTNKKNIAKYILLQFLILLSAFTVAGCYSWWEDEFAVDTTKTRVSLGTLLYNSPAITSLEKPSQVLASQGLYSGSIKIHWTQVENAESYDANSINWQPETNWLIITPDGEITGKATVTIKEENGNPVSYISGTYGIEVTASKKGITYSTMVYITLEN